MRPNRILGLTVAIFLSALTAHAASTIVYSNATFYSGSFLNPGLSEVGDEIILGAGPRVAESFRFEYYGSGFHGNESFEIRFYNNNGPTNYPNTIFYDSGLQSLAAPTDPSGRATYQFDLTYASLVLPDDFTWSVQFGGVDSGVGEVAGPVIYDPPTVGNNFDDYWVRNGLGNWQLTSNASPVSFGAAITTVPEPSTYMLAIVGGLCGFALINRRRSRKH